jgi:hypothetical protein
VIKILSSTRWLYLGSNQSFDAATTFRGVDLSGEFPSAAVASLEDAKIEPPPPAGFFDPLESAC